MRRSLLIVALVLAGCAGDSGSEVPERPPVLHAGRGALETWTFRPAGPPRAVVAFLHGLGDEREATPANHRAWIEHLVAGGSAVIYPKYEAEPGHPAPMRSLLSAVGASTRALGSPPVPHVVVGFSRGGRLAVEYAASAGTAGGVAPAAVLSVFPGALGSIEENVGLEFLDPATEIRILIGDADDVVGGEGAKGLLARLRNAGFPTERVGVAVVRSRDGFVAHHLAPLETTPAARTAFWARADDLIASVAAG